jgi:hypothetical protein
MASSFFRIGGHLLSSIRFLPLMFIAIIGISLLIANSISHRTNLKRMDDNRCPPILKNELAIHIPFKQAIVEYALANWLDSHTTHRSKGESGAYYYKDSVYQQIGI